MRFIRDIIREKSQTDPEFGAAPATAAMNAPPASDAEADAVGKGGAGARSPENRPHTTVLDTAAPAIDAGVRDAAGFTMQTDDADPMTNLFAPDEPEVDASPPAADRTVGARPAARPAPSTKPLDPTPDDAADSPLDMSESDRLEPPDRAARDAAAGGTDNPAGATISTPDMPATPSVQVPEPAVGRGGGRHGRTKTRVLGFNGADVEDATDPLDGGREALTASVARFPVGWLIVVAGPGRGTVFTLHHGVSRIGRGEDQTVRLDFGDTSISRENHAAIAFDPRQKGFFIGQSGKANLVRRNDRPLLSTEELSSGDRITVGETTLHFVALCGPEFAWGETEESGLVHASDK